MNLSKRVALLTPLFLAAALTAGCVTDTTDPDAPDSLPQPGTLRVDQPLVLADRARVPETEPGFLAVTVSDGQLSIDHDGTLPRFNTGDVLAGTDAGGYLVRVTSVLAADNTHVRLGTEPAALTELLREGKVHVRYDAADYARRLQEAVLAARDAQEDETPADGAGATGDDLAIARTAQALQATAGVAIPLVSVSAADLPASCGVTAIGAADIDVHATLTPVLDLDLHVGSKGGLNPMPELKELRLVLSGTLDVEATLHGTGDIVGSCTLDLVDLAGGAAKIPLPALTFWVGPVPLVVTSEVLPVATARVDLGFEAASLTATAHGTASLSAGVEYESKEWSTVWEPSGAWTGAATIESPGALTASCKVSAGAELRARLYGILGPTVGVEAYARASAASEAPYCTYEGAIDGGIRGYASAEAGVSVGPLDLTLVSLPLCDYELAHFDGPEFSGALRDAQECEGL
ncbi:MAG: hypothetical protein R3F14_04385 [Polyangiaceae bacterium]